MNKTFIESNEDVLFYQVDVNKSSTSHPFCKEDLGNEDQKMLRQIILLSAQVQERYEMSEWKNLLTNQQSSDNAGQRPESNRLDKTELAQYD